MNLKTIKIHGKEYVEVHERIKYFRYKFSDYSLITIIREHTDDYILCEAQILNNEGRLIATGNAKEYKASSYINKTSYVENCETSAWGRALANFGIGIDSSIATYEEISNAEINIKPSSVKVESKPKVEVKELQVNDENWDKVVKYCSQNKDLGLNVLVQKLSKGYIIKPKVKTALNKAIKASK